MERSRKLYEILGQYKVDKKKNKLYLAANWKKKRVCLCGYLTEKKWMYLFLLTNN